MLGNGRFTLLDHSDAVVASRYKWVLNDKGYAVSSFPKNKKVRLHRFIMNPNNGVEIDHKNGDRSDNRRLNLRECSTNQNRANSKRRSHNKASQFKGVRNNNNSPNQWMARASFHRKQVNIGYFKTEIEAAIAYNRWASQAWGEFARLNPIPPTLMASSEFAT